jgi:Flagellar P-ring protein
MQSHSKFVARRRLIQLPCSMLLIASVGCVGPWFQKPDPHSPEAQQARRERLKQLLASDERPRLISEIATSRLLTMSRIENLGLVTQLAGTGGVVNASDQREKMLNTMRRHEVPQPNKLLDDPSTAMVVVYVDLPPAARKYSVHNVGVKKSDHAEATSLRGGWLMRTELSETSFLGGKLHEGFEFAAGEGQIVTESQLNGKTDPDAHNNGIIIGGAKLNKQRPLGIAFLEEFADAVTQAAVLPAINERFTVFDGQKKDGIATPLKNNYVELEIPQRYEKDPYHFIHVVLSLGFAESAPRRVERMELCKRQLSEPTTVRSAAWQLEAIGKEAIPILAEALTHPDPEVRFYTAHALAYLNDVRCVPVLKNLAPQQAAFRAMCLTALATLDHHEAENALLDLLHAADAETRYGAMLALRSRDADNPLVKGIAVGKTASILQIPSNAPPLVAISLEQRPEIVIFGETPVLTLPPFLQISPRIVLKYDNSNMVTISRFAPDEEDRVTQCKNDLPSLLTAISSVGGSYGDWISFIRECSKYGFMIEPFALNPAPSAGRVFDRTTKQSVTSRVEPGEDLPETTFHADNKSDDEKNVAAWYNPFTWGKK